jgi:TolA-binding protein
MGSASGPLSPTARLTAWLDEAKAALAAHDYSAASLRAETVLLSSVAPAEVRGAALLIAADAAFGAHAYARAARHYEEFVADYGLAAEAAQAELAQGWAELRSGDPARARHTWTQMARRYPVDGLAAQALLLAAHLDVQTGDLSRARRLLDQLLSRYPSGPAASVARLSRSILAVQAGREQDAAQDLQDLLRAGQVCAANDRYVLMSNLSDVDRVGPRWRLTDHECLAPASGGHPLERFAAPFLDGAGGPDTTPSVLHGLVLVGAAAARWTEVQALSSDLVTRFPSYPATAGLLVRIARRAAADQRWPVVRQAYEMILAHYATSMQLAPESWLDYAEALLRTGAPTAAQAQLLASPQVREDDPRRLFLLGQVDETLGHPNEALATYEVLAHTHPEAEWTAEALLPRARLLEVLGRRRQARLLLEKIVKSAPGSMSGEAACRLADSLNADGEKALALTWYLTAAYLNEDSTWGQRAQLGALRTLLATGEVAAADAIYQRMRASQATNPELLSQAREALHGESRGR